MRIILNMYLLSSSLIREGLFRETEHISASACCKDMYINKDTQPVEDQIKLLQFS